MLKVKAKRAATSKEKKKPLVKKEIEPFKNDDSSKDIHQFYKNKLTYLETKLSVYESKSFISCSIFLIKKSKFFDYKSTK